jgi:hypothetical protein
MSKSRRFVLAFATSFAVSVAAGCKENLGPPTPTAPSGPPATLQSLVGDWAGTINTGKGVDLCYGFTWSPALGGPGVTGRSGIGGIDRRPPYESTGATMTGTLSGTTLSLALNFPPGAYGGNACSMMGSGTARASESEVSGSITMNFTDACVGVAFNQSVTAMTQTGTLTLKKGGSVPMFCS